MLAGGRGSGLKQLCPLISLCRQSLRLMQTEAEFLELPASYGVAEAFDVDAAREPPDSLSARSGRIFSRRAPWGSWVPICCSNASRSD